jgi:monothiol glutaredoxin
MATGGKVANVFIVFLDNLELVDDTAATGGRRPCFAHQILIECRHLLIPFLQRQNQMSDVQTWIKETVTSTPVVLFMKGTAQFPQCGFSGRAIQILKACGVDNVATVNVLDDAEVRQGIKDYSNWPTIPQLYVKGEFIGGTDIMNEMYESGELQTLLKNG